MTSKRKKRASAALPLALAAVTVAGQCRERSPADLAIFGPAASRFVDRFADVSDGEAVLAEAVSEGMAETTARMRTGSGTAPFRVALWRQRGGERIRLIASFVHTPTAPVSANGQTCGMSGDLIEIYGSQLRHPLSAIMGFAERLRRGGDDVAPQAPAVAGDILAASWRLLRVLDDLVLSAELGTDRPPLRMGEVDVIRLIHRVLRLAEPIATAAGIKLSYTSGGQTSGPTVLADEAALWTVLETLVRVAISAALPGGTVMIGCRTGSEGLTLRVKAELKAGQASLPELGVLEELCTANGITLTVEDSAEFGVWLAFPPERCINTF